jgi:GNAT superfamily N-acetyltransferase
MANTKSQFLEGILGGDGAKALSKAAARIPELESALLPRALMAWLGVCPTSFEGNLPGVENSYLHFQKSEGNTYSGSIAIGDDIYAFEDASGLRVGACVAVALGADHEKLNPALADTDLVRLGKSIDTLVRARAVVEALQKRVLDPSLGYSFSHEHHDLGPQGTLTKVNVHSSTGEHVGAATFRHQGGSLVPGTVVVDDDHQRKGIASAMYAHAQKQTGKAIVPSSNQTPEGAALWQGNKTQQQFGLGKAAMKPNKGGAEAPGPAAAPLEPAAPAGPAAAQATQTGKGPTVSMRPKPPTLPQPGHRNETVQTGPGLKAPKPAAPVGKPPAGPRTPTLKVSKSQAEIRCGICGETQFHGDSFSGCTCFKALRKGVQVQVVEDGYRLSFGADWDNDAILTLLESMETGNGR